MLAFPAITGAANVPRNPLNHLDTADPGIVVKDSVIYTYSTSGCESGGSFHIRRSENRIDWEHIGFILTKDNKPDWITGCHFWAPEVHHIGGRYVAYFTARNRDGRFCIGAATASDPAGPFEPALQPIAENPRVGLIDASYFYDEAGSQGYLLYKEDSNALTPQEPTGIFIVPVSEDGLSTTGEPIRLVENDQPWEGAVVEAPFLIRHDGLYYLFYSGNAFYADTYGVGVARSENLAGTYRKYPGNPILRSSETFDGPGHCFLVEEFPQVWTMYYHARERATESKARVLMADPVLWSADQWPYIQNGVPGGAPIHQRSTE